jgi:hypothetical protein
VRVVGAFAWFGSGIATVPIQLLLCLAFARATLAATLSDTAVDSYNTRIGTQTFSGLYKFTTNTLLVETAQAITNMGSDTIKLYMGHNTSGQSGVTLGANITNLLTLARDEPSYRRVLDMPFRHFIMWEYPFSNPDAPFQDGNYTATEQANDYREMYDLTHYLLTNYNNSAKTFYLGHWEGDGYLEVNGWTTNPSPAVVSNMIIWENNRQKAVDDAKAATTFANVSVFYYAEANRVRDAMLNGPTNNVRMMDAVIPYVTNLDYVSYSSYDAMNLSSSSLYATLDYMEAHLPTNKAGVVPGERIWIGEYGWGGSQTTDQQEPTTRAYIQRLLNYPGHALPFILFWEIYDNETNTDGSLKNFCLINSNNVKAASWYLHNYFMNDARMLVAQFKETNGRLPTDTEFVSLVSPLLNQPLPAPVALTVANLGYNILSNSAVQVSGTLAQGIYGDDRATVSVFWGRQDGGTSRAAWEQNQFLGVNTNFNPATFTTTLTNLTQGTNYFFRFYTTNASGEVWAPASAQFSTAAPIVPQDYGSNMKITFSGYHRSESLSNFPLLVNFSTNLPGFSYRQFASPSGGDLRFANSSGVQQIPFEIDEWNTNGVSSVWVSVPQLSGPGDSIWAYWGNPAATNLPSSSTNGAVWSANHFLVWHLKETGFPFADSAEQYPALPGVAPSSTTGEIGHGCSFDGASQYLNAGAINLGNAFTLSAWVNLSSTAPANIRTIWANKQGGFSAGGFALYVNTYQTNDGKVWLETGNGTSGTAAFTAAGVVGSNQWHRITAAVDRAGGTAHLYVDGTDQTQSRPIRTDLGNQGLVNLGRFTNSNFYWKGALDEARIEIGARSSNWVWAAAMNVLSNATFASYSTVTQQLPALALTAGANGLTLNWPGNGVGFALFTTTDLTSPTVWSPATNTASLVNNQWQVGVPPTDSNVRFYRLRSQ